MDLTEVLIHLGGIEEWAQESPTFETGECEALAIAIELVKQAIINGVLEMEG